MPNAKTDEGKNVAEPLKKKVQAIVMQMEALKNNMSPVAMEQMDEAELSVRLDYVENVSTKFDAAQSALEEIGEVEVSIAERMNFTSLYLELKSAITRQKRRFSGMMPSSTLRQTSFEESARCSKHIRIPEIQLPKFGGNYLDWPNFYGLFSTVIDDNMELTDLEKFHHLRTNLYDAALDTIASLELVPANYREAVSILKKRFDNKTLHFQTHLKEIFGLNVVGSEAGSGLRQLCDKINSHLRALKSMATLEEISDGFLIHLVVSKMDVASQVKWEEQLSLEQLPTWFSFSTFLERRCRMLENLDNSVIEKNPKQSTSRKFNQNRHVHVTSANYSPSCVFCNSKDHYITDCASFKLLSPVMRFQEAKNRKLCLNCLRRGHMMKKCLSSGCCRKCSAKHHTLLHIEPTSAPNQTNDPHSPENSSSVLVNASNVSLDMNTSSASVLLATAVVLIKSYSGNFIPCRAILDSAAQTHLITCQLVNRLGIKCNRTRSIISGVGDGNLVINKSAEVEVKSCCRDFSTEFTALVVPSITSYQANVELNMPEWKIPDNIYLADPNFDKCGRIDVLIGTSLFYKLLSMGQIKIADHLPILQKTLFGWVVAGGISAPSKSCVLLTSVNESAEQQLTPIIKSFWELEESYSSDYEMSSEDQFCEQHFMTRTQRDSSGSYSVELPMKVNTDATALGNSFHHALQRFNSLERKFKKLPDTKSQYVSFLREYLALGHMSLVSSQISQKQYFLPHHCVHKSDSTSTKLRVVFDGSAKTTTGLSLNDILCAGPTIQPKLFITLLRYRSFKFALSGDICKMYRCVRVSSPHDYLQCILWRESPNEDLKTYKLNTVTYGTKPAAFLAIRAMHQLATDEEANYPLGAKIVRRDFYVDDMISGGDSVSEVLAIRQEVSDLLRKGQFVIRKWCSNEPAILSSLPSDQCETFLKFHDGTNVTKTLGLVWDPKLDNFIFCFTPMQNSSFTKRCILSSIARLYDPLGLLGPIITRAKIFMQSLWKLDLDWDESLPQHLHTSWLQFISQFSEIPHFTFPRYVSTPAADIQIHAFCDASLLAYGACVYVRSELNNVVKVLLLCSKSRVAPVKSLTVPKLELCAANLLAELITSVVQTLPYECAVYCWSDSTVALSWIRGQACNFTVFVANRVTRIQQLTDNMEWRYVPTDENPADILSRGASPQELLKSEMWNCGPKFLSFKSENWPPIIKCLPKVPEMRKHVLITSSLEDLSINCKYHNTFPKLQRIFGYVFRFINLKNRINLSKSQSHELNKQTRENWLLEPGELNGGIQLLIKNIQQIHFGNDFKLLTENKSVAATSKLYSLMPILDSIGLIRVGGRLQNSELSFEAQHPLILPKSHHFTATLVMHFHQKLLHAGPQSLLAVVRQQYWPIGGRKYISSIISKCLRCFRMKPIISQHIMGSLPTARVTPSRAFFTTGIDYCGPFYYKPELRTRQPLKCYICIFICFATKASHLEVVQDLSTNSFLAALKRFIATRGKPKTIWSDNATNFVGGKNELIELKQLFSSQNHIQAVQRDCLDEAIEWKFIPPRSPHFGGLWEAAVKTAKYHFYRVVGLHVLTFDELRTLTCQISAIMNSRPLCPLSDNPNDLEVLTPGHFLIGGPLMSITEPSFIDIHSNRLGRWQLICQMHQIFWQKWSVNYLSLLQERGKWRASLKNVAIGSMVLLKDENCPPLKWQLGRVTDVILGNDSVARVILVRTAKGIIKRAVSKVAVLPIDEPVGDSNSPTGGGC